MFYGEYDHALDRKGRLVVPAKVRDVLAEYQVETCYVTRGLDGCLFLFTDSEWRSQEMKFKSIPFTRAEARRFNRLYFSGACEVQPDKQGRILLPKTLKEHAGIQREVVFVGVSNRLEIWSKERWQEYYQGSHVSFEDVAERFLTE